MIFVAAIVLSIALFYFTENPHFFSASILSLQDAETMRENSRDIWYKNENNILDVFVSDLLKGVDYLTISIIYDIDDVTLQLDSIRWQLEYEVISHLSWSLVVRFKNFTDNFDYAQSLFELDFEWERPSILLSEWSATLANWSIEYLSIWLLNTDRQDGFHGILSKN